MKKIIYILLFLPFSVRSQANVRNKNFITEDSSINKWTHAILNIECRQSLQKYYDYYQNQELFGKITREQSDSIRNVITNTISWQRGTAIFLTDSGRYFLLTVKHVVNDPTVRVGQKNVPCLKIICIENDTTIGFWGRNWVNASNRIYFSSDEKDLALIYLGEPDASFLEAIKLKGYIPIKVSDVRYSALKKDQDIMVFGFPDESIIKTNNNANLFWFSEITSIPVISKGTYVGPNDSSSFNGNVFIYHGYSGGPCINNNKLVGIVHGLTDRPEIVTTANDYPFKHYAINHTKFINASEILKFLKSTEKIIAQKVGKIQTQLWNDEVTY